MKATIHIGADGVCYWNLLWSGRWPRRGGTHPSPHPCHENPKPMAWRGDIIPESSDPLGRLRSRGYFASCFPEGDGLAFRPPANKTLAQVELDFKECFPNLDIGTERTAVQ